MSTPVTETMLPVASWQYTSGIWKSPIKTPELLAVSCSVKPVDENPSAPSHSPEVQSSSSNVTSSMNAPSSPIMSMCVFEKV